MFLYLLRGGGVVRENNGCCLEEEHGGSGRGKEIYGRGKLRRGEGWVVPSIVGHNDGGLREWKERSR